MGVFSQVYLENELVGLAQFGRVLVELLVLFDLVVVRSVEQQLLDVSGLQPVGGHVHQDLAQLGGGELQMGDEDGCREEEEEEEELEGLRLFFFTLQRGLLLPTADKTFHHPLMVSTVYYSYFLLCFCVRMIMKSQHKPAN